MGQPVSAPAKYRFGTFELDRGSAELRKRGIRVKLQEQPYRIICLLLDNPGEVITRETLCAVLWPEDTFVEFERSLNAAIAKLRQTLGDSAENPRFIETVARRGYRFIAPVEAIASSESAIGIGRQSPEIAEQHVADVNHPPTLQASTTTHHKKVWILGAAVAILLAAAGIAIIIRPHPIPIVTPEVTRLTFDSGLTADPAVSPDEKLLAYASDRDGSGQLHIWVQQLIPGGQAMQLTRGEGEDHQPAFSPDGSKLVFRSEREGGGLYVIPAIGGEANLVAKEGRDPRFSPDGRWIAYWVGVDMGAPFVANAGTVYLVPSTGGTPQRVRSDLQEAGAPVWSQDGTRLLVYGTKTELFPLTADWWVVPVQGGSAKPTGAFAYLQKQGFAVGWRDAPRVAAWSRDELLFSARVGDSINLWKLHIAGSDSRVTGNLQRLTSGTGLDVYPSLTADGRLVFASLTNSLNVWTLPLDANTGKVAGQARPATQRIGPHQWASLSADGKLLAYSSVQYGHPHVWIKDLESRKEWRLTSTAESERNGQLSSDGSRVAYLSGDQKANGFVAPVRGGVPDHFCTDCASLYDLSPDSRVVLYRKGRVIRAFDLRSRQDGLFLRSDEDGFFQTKLSADNRWVTFGAARHGRSWVFVAPVLDTVTGGPKNEWIRLTGDESWADKPRWSPDGNLIYFISNRDGFFCLWAQRLAAQTKRPIGTPVSIAHFHGGRLSLANVGFSVLGLSVARDKIAFNLGELTGNIWVTNLSR
ncbi:MAG: winged helix-turn-helix domain-containing protein [Bryobacteraceae bacterium]